MTSVGIQADVFDPEGVMGNIASLRNQLQEVEALNDNLSSLRQARSTAFEATLRHSEQLEEKVNELVGRADKMGDRLAETRHELSQGDRELEDLINEKERLESEAGEMHGQEVHITNTDIDNEKRLTGFVEEELYRKMEELCSLHQRLADTKEELNQEWNGLKNDVNSHKGETERYEEEIDHVDELTLARFIGMQEKSDIASSEQDLIQRLVAHHWNKITHRRLQQQLTDAQITEKDLENDIGAIVNEKKNLWKRCLDLENCLDELKDTSEETNLLRPTSAYTDLPHMLDGTAPRESSSDIQFGESIGFHGKMLHRCHKATNISIGESMSDENQASVSNQVDSGALDTDTDKLDSGKKQNESAPPAPERDEPENEPDTEDDKPDKDLDQLRNAVQEKLLMKLGGDPATTSDTGSKRPASHHATSDADAMAPDPSLMSKLRRRVGIGGGGISSSSQRLKGEKKISASGSTKRLDPSQFPKRRR